MARNGSHKILEVEEHFSTAVEVSISGHHRRFDLMSADWSRPPFGTFFIRIWPENGRGTGKICSLIRAVRRLGSICREKPSTSMLTENRCHSVSRQGYSILDLGKSAYHIRNSPCSAEDRVYHFLIIMDSWYPQQKDLRCSTRVFNWSRMYPKQIENANQSSNVLLKLFWDVQNFLLSKVNLLKHAQKPPKSLEFISNLLRGGYVTSP